MNMSEAHDQQAVVLEDDENLATAYGKLLKSLGYQVRLAHRVSHARAFIRDRSPDLILVDITLPDGNGLDLMNELRNDTRGRFVVVSGDESQLAAIKSIRHRAIEQLVKPVTLEQLKRVLKVSDKKAAIQDSCNKPSTKTPGADSRNRTSSKQLAYDKQRSSGSSCWINAGECQELSTLRSAISVAAGRLRGHALIMGQPGVEKPAVARELHRRSRRAGKLVLVDCSAEQGSAGMERLFGKEDPTTQEVLLRGLIEQAAGGTLVLDYIEQLPVEAQSKLTSVLDSGYYKRMYAQTASQTNVAVVAIARKSNTHDVDETSLRTEFLFRLAEISLKVPSLKQCRTSSMSIAEALLSDIAKRERRALEFEASATAYIEKGEWLGNVRELRSAIARAVAHTERGQPVQMGVSMPGDTFGSDDTAESRDSAAERQIAPWVGKTIAEMEQQLLLATLSHFDGDKRLTANTLQISLKTLYNRMKALGGQS